MNRNEIPNNVRDAFDRLADAQFFTDKDVAAARGELDKANAQHAAAVDFYVELRRELDSLALEAEGRANLIEELTAERIKLLPDFFLKGTGVDEIDELDVRIAACRRYVDDFALARPLIEAQLSDRNREISGVVGHQQGAEDKYDAVLFRLKLAEAERLALSS